MPQIIFVEASGNELTIDAETGSSLMVSAVNADVPGIMGECGGSLTCATCHVYVDEARLGELAPIEDMEAQMLEFVAAERRAGSRLACQIIVSEALDGLRVGLPDTQV